jgi:hypothetical protein
MTLNVQYVLVPIWHESVKLLFCDKSENFTVIFASQQKLNTAHLN